MQAFELRFDASARQRIAARLKSGWGAPLSEVTEAVKRRNQSERRIYKARWVRGQDQAVLTAPLQGKRATLRATRGPFDEEIYRVR